MNLPIAISPTTTSFAAARNADGSECSRASDRKTNFAIAMSAVASMPCPVTSPSTTASRPSRELEEVEDVAADVDLRGGLVDRTDLEPGDRRPLAGQQRPLHRLGELLLLLVEARVVDRERGLLRDRARGRERLARDRRRGIERDDRQLRRAARSPSRSAAARPSSRRAGTGRRSECAPPSRSRSRRRACSGSCVRGGRGCGRSRIARTASASRDVGDVDRPRDELVASLVRDADHGGIDVRAP